MKSKFSNTIGLLSVLCFTFSITAFNLEDYSFSANLKPYILILLAIVSLVWWLQLRKSSEK